MTDPKIQIDSIKILKIINNDFFEAIVVFSFLFLVNGRSEKIIQRRQKKRLQGKIHNSPGAFI